MKILRFLRLAALLAAVFVGPGLARAQNGGSVGDLHPLVPSQTVALADGESASGAGQAPVGVLTDEELKYLRNLAKAEKEKGDKKKDIEQNGYEVGTDLSLKSSMKDGLFTWLETPNKDFTMHLSLWTQWDNVWWNQSSGLKAGKGANAGLNKGANNQDVASGATLGGIGDLQAGTYMRRIRPNVEGTFWETGEYRFIPAFENSQFATAGIDEMWVGMKELPLFGRVRLGHVKNACGLEGDMTASSRCMTFMERSSYSEAILMNQNFGTGVWINNNYLDERAASTFVIMRPDQGSSTDAFFGNGQYGLQARLTALPMYENDGRDLLHLGVSGGYRNGTTNLANVSGSVRAVQLRAREEMRDDVPGGGLVNGDANRMVDTGVLASDEQWLMGLETLYIRGPLSLQAEYGWNCVNNVTGVFNPYAASPSGYFAPLATPQAYVFSGGYLQVAYSLTGEARGYDRGVGSLARSYFGKTGPFRNACWVRDEDGNLISSWGAWEIASRISYVNLNNGTGLTAVRGGEMQGFGLALNWYLNSNLTINFDWNYDERYNLPVSSAAPNDPTKSSIPGSTSGFGTRVQFQF